MKRTTEQYSLLPTLILSGLFGLFLGTAHAEEKAREEVFVGYLFGPARGINYRLYTHICHAFLKADGDGRLQKDRNVPSREVVDEAHRAGVKMLLSLGGWGFDEQFGSIISNPQAEERYVRTVIEIVNRDDYDGIDLDWEYPDTEIEVVGFERLARRFRKELDAIARAKGRPMLQTMAASSNPGTIRWLDKDFLLETMDWVNVMTYDYTGNWTDYAGHHAPLFASAKQPEENPRSVEATMRYLTETRKIPADRLAVGIPLYGRGFSVAEPYASTKGAPKASISEARYRDLPKLRDQQGWTRLWDDQTKTPWLVAPDRKALIGYDDAESVAIKTDWATGQGFRGVFFWETSGDRLPDGSNPLQESSKKRWEAGRRRDDR